MNDVRIIFTRQRGSRKADLCADDTGHFLLLFSEDGNSMGSSVAQDLGSGLELAQSFLLESLDREAVDAELANAAAIAGVNYSVEEVAAAVYRLDFLAGKEKLFSSLFQDETEARAVGAEYMQGLNGWSLHLQTWTPPSRPSTGLIYRQNSTHKAWIVRVTPGTWGGMMGIALRVYHGQNMIFGKFRLFPKAVEEGNVYVPLEEAAEGPAAVPEPALDGDTGFEFSRNNIKTKVVQLPNVLPPGYKVVVYVDGRTITQLMKDQNHGGYTYTLSQAISRAKSLVNALQGWHAH